MTVDSIQNEIIEEMSVLDGWMDKYEYLISMGKKLSSFDEKLRIEQNAIKGCQANVWITAELNNNKICFSVDSDSMITKGMLALLLRVLNNQSPEEIVNAELYFIKRTGLSTNLSPTRANGLALIVKHMKLYGSMYL